MTTKQKITDGELKNLVEQFMKDLSRKYPEMRYTNENRLKEEEDIDLYLFQNAETFYAALKRADEFSLSSIVAGTKEDVSMKYHWIAYFFYLLSKYTIIGRV